MASPPISRRRFPYPPNEQQNRPVGARCSDLDQHLLRRRGRKGQPKARRGQRSKEKRIPIRPLLSPGALVLDGFSGYRAPRRQDVRCRHTLREHHTLGRDAGCRAQRHPRAALVVMDRGIATEDRRTSGCVSTPWPLTWWSPAAPTHSQRHFVRRGGGAHRRPRSSHGDASDNHRFRWSDDDPGWVRPDTASSEGSAARHHGTRASSSDFAKRFESRASRKLSRQILSKPRTQMTPATRSGSASTVALKAQSRGVAQHYERRTSTRDKTRTTRHAADSASLAARSAAP